MGDLDQANKEGDSGGEIAYASQLSPETRADTKLMELLKKAPKLNDLVGQYARLHERAGRSIVIPNKDKPDPEELKAFREAMGLPESEKDIEIKTDGFKGIEGADQIAVLTKKQALAMGLTKTQGQKLFELIMGLSKVGKDQSAAAKKQAADSFEARLMDAVGKDEKKKAAALNMFKHFMVKHIGDSSIIQRLADSGLVHDPTFVLKVMEIQEKLGEEPFVDGGEGEKKPEQRDGSQGEYSQEFKNRYGKEKK